ncbi:nSTAND1 domain-containing NTPase [Streptomyces sp. NPDC054834]
MAGRPESPLDPSAGPVQRLAFELRKLRSEAGSPTYRAMAERTGHGASTLSQAAAGERLPTLPVVLAYVRACAGDQEEWEERWRTAHAETAAEPRADEPEAEPPYRGLARFEAADAALFFGRDRLTDRLVELTRTSRFTAVFGPSGSGKSSLLRAGLIPRLRTADREGPRPAALRVLTPGGHPMRVHADRLVPKDADGDTWLIVDQFEELYTLCDDSAERDRFIDRLLTATDPASRLRVVIGVRADFLGRCAVHPGLTAALQDATLLVAPMNRDELREAIVKPAQAAGCIVERPLTARLLTEVEGEPGALPLMSHALLETWRRRRSRALNEGAYAAAGGLHGAIARTAEEAFGRLTATQSALAQRILLRLISPGEGTSDTRRPADRAELVGSAPEDARDDAAVILERLAAARLITLDGDTVDLAHEAVISAWPRLRGWIDAERDRLRTHRRLTEAARVWQDLDRDPGALYRGTRLATAAEAFAAPGQRTALTELEWSFLSAGIEAAEHERRSAARTARRTRTFVMVLSAVVAMALVAGLVAWQQNRAGERRKVQAEARRIAAVAESLRASDPVTAMRLSLAAWKIADLPETRSALQGAMAQKNQDAFRIPGPADADTGATYLSDGGRIAVSVESGRATEWDVRAHHRLSSFRIPSAEETATVRSALSPDGRTLAVGTGRYVNLYDVRTGRRTGRLPDIEVASLSFGPSGRTLLLAATEINVTRLWDVRRHKLLFQTGKAPRPGEILDLGTGLLLGSGVGSYVTAFIRGGAADVSTDDRFLADCSHDRIEVWNVATHRRSPGPWTAVHSDQCASAGIRFVPAGNELAITTNNGTRMWDVPSGKERTGIRHRGLEAAAYTPDGRFVVACDDHEVLLWRLDAPQTPVFRAPVTAQTPSDLALDQRDGLIRYVSSGASTTVRSLSLGHALPAGYRQDVTTGAAFSSDGRLLAVARQSGGRHRLRLIDVTRDKVLTDRLPTAPCPVEDGEPGCTDKVALSPDGRTLLYSSMNWDEDDGLRLTAVDTSRPGGRTTFRVPAPSDDEASIDALALGDSGAVVLSLSGDGIERWDMRRHARTGRWSNASGEALAVPDDGRFLVTPDGQVIDFATGRMTRHVLTQGSPTVVALSHDGDRLAAGDEDGWVTLWDGRARRRLGELPVTSAATSDGGNDGSAAVSAIAFSHDGSTLAVGTGDGNVHLWDVTTRLPIGSALSSSGGRVTALAFRADDRTLYVSGQHVPLESYDIAPDQVAGEVCRRVGTGLPRSEWRTYVRDVPYRASC